MKFFATLSVLFLSTLFLQAQHCDTYYRWIEGATYEYGYFDKKGKPEGRDLHKIETISESEDGVLRAEIHSKFIPEKKKQETAEATAEIFCKDGSIQMDLSFTMSQMMTQFENMEVTMDGEPIEIPYDLKVGQTLPDATTKIKSGVNGMSLLTVTMSVTDRKVEAKESITTPAGTFECFKISQTSTVKTIVSKTFNVVEYYAAGTGLIRSETFSKNGKLESRRDLLSITE